MNMLAPALGLIFLGACAAALIIAELSAPDDSRRLHWWALLLLNVGVFTVSIWLVTL